MAKNTKTIAGNSNDMISPNVSIRLKDGTEFDAVINGTTYESGKEIPAEKFTDDNLSEVTINGTVYRDMKLICAYPWDEGTRFALREMTDQEIENRNLKTQLQAAQKSVAELTIIVSGLMM
nr:MAG TPA: hypothetical protein [Caudoviricetes sp.]